MFRKLGELGKRWNEVAPLVLDFMNTVDDSKKSEVAQKINEFYGIGSEITTKNVSGLSTASTSSRTKILLLFLVVFR